MVRWKQSILRIVVVVAMVGGCSRSPQAQEARYLEKGKKEFEQKYYANAIVHFKNAMQAQPKDAEPYYQLGLSYLALKNLNTAASYFLKATELNPKHTGAQLKVAELMANSRSSKEVLEQAQKRSQEVLNLLPENIDALNILAITELRLGKPQSAEAHLEQALRTSPSNLRSSIALARSKLARKNAAGAEEVLKQAAAHAPKDPEPADYLGEFYRALGRTAEAEQQFRHALQIDPKHGPALLGLASMQARAGQTEQADQTYRQVSALPDKQYRPIHASYLFQSGKREQAVAELEKLAQDDPADRTLRVDLVRAYLALNRVADAEKVLSAALQKNPRDTDALLQRSRIYLVLQKYAEAEADLNQVLHSRSESAEAHYLLAKVQQGRGRTATQQQELGEALRLDPNYLAARLERAQALIATGGAQTALELLDKAPEEQKKTTAVIAQRNWALLALGQIGEARKGIDHVLAAGKVPEALLQDAIVKMNQKDFAGSRAVVSEVLSKSPDNTRALRLLLQSYSAENRASAGLQEVREYASQHPASAPVQQFLGQLLLANGDRKGARKALEATKAANPGLVSADLGLAELDTSEGKREEARKRLSAIIASHPDIVAAHLLLAQLEATDRKPALAIEYYRKALALDEKNVFAINNLANLLADAGQPDEALKYAQQAKELAPASPAIDDTIGWTYYQKGMFSQAVSYLESAVSKESTARRQYHLAMARLKAGDLKRGRQALEAAQKLDPSLPEAQMANLLFSDTRK